MTEEQFWRGNPWLVVSYREAYKLKLNARNYDSWWLGAYIYEGVSVVAQNILKKKGAKAERYPDNPHDIFPKKMSSREKRKAELDKFVRSMDAWQKAWDNKHGR